MKNTKAVPVRGQEYKFKFVRPGRPTIKTGLFGNKSEWWREFLEA